MPMPSFASALSFGRGGKSDFASTSPSSSSTPPPLSGPVPRLAKSRSTSLFAKAPKTPVETATSVLSRPQLTPGSSCSSDGSASLQTPEDEAVMPPFLKSNDKPDEKKRRLTWFGFRKQSEKGSSSPTDDPLKAGSSPPQHADATRGDRQKQQRATQRELRQSPPDSSDDEEQTSSESSEYTGTSTVIARRPAPPRSAIVQARANMRTLLRNTLSWPPSPPPLVETSSATLFPRSCASVGRRRSGISSPSSSPQHALSLESSMHVRRMLWRLDRQTLSDVEVDSILGLAQRPRPKDACLQNRMEKRSDDDIIAYATMRVGRFSRGLRKWASRPNFEQRFCVYTPDDRGDIICKGVVSVRGLAVCELEFSEGLEALAGLDLDDDTFEQNLFPVLPPKKLTLKTTPRTQFSPPGTPRKSSFHRTPSSLRIDHAAPAEPVLSTVSSLSSAVPNAPASAPTLDSRSSDGPRGAASERGGIRVSPTRDNADTESIPLGYAIQAKKRREEKALFLHAEQEKRAKELTSAEKQRRQIEERRELEERRRREEERKRVEEEKRIRDERLREKYNEEVAASRQRRESARLGMENYQNIREAHQTENRRTYSRPAYDPTAPPVRLPRRSASESATPGQVAANASSNSSRPNSSTESNGDKRRSLVAPSQGSHHQLADDNRSASNRRLSVGTEASQRPHGSRPPSIVSSTSRPTSIRMQSAPNPVPMMGYPMIPTMPMMTPMPQMPVVPIPPVPPMPMWNMNMGMGMGMGMNMPLLPPNAPFMMQQYSRSPSPGSSPHSRDHSPSSPSRRQIDVPPPSPSRRQSNLHSSSPSPSRRQHTGQSSSGPTHSRNPSGDNNHPADRRGNGNAPQQRPVRSSSQTALQQSVSQPIHRDARSQKPRYGSSTNIAHMDPKRRTSVM